MLKIDAHFVRGIETEAKANERLIVEAITGLARQFGFATLAEGIETEAEAATLMQLGCEMGQGFLLAKPLPQAEFEARFLPLPGDAEGG
jgi:EAL domain-containing protein (putative c-di-GMP-specific phosphodiesterase class I)